LRTPKKAGRGGVHNQNALKSRKTHNS